MFKAHRQIRNSEDKTAIEFGDSLMAYAWTRRETGQCWSVLLHASKESERFNFSRLYMLISISPIIDHVHSA